MNNTARHFVAEFVGTYALVFVGGGAIMMSHRPDTQAGLVTVALAHGLILALMVSATMNVSGGHLNPAVTFGILVARRISLPMALLHLVAQLAGAVCAALTLKGVVPHETFAAVRGGTQFVALDVTMTQAIVLEAVATFFLVFVVFGTAVDPEAPKLGGMAIGLTIAADIMAIGPLTGASMNPARSFGPAVASGSWEGHIVYWVGPLIGGALAGLVWDHVLLRKTAPA